MIGMPNINQYFKVAMGYPIAKLQAIIRGQDHSIPAIAAMAAFEIKGPMEIAAKAQQALQKQSPISVRDKLAQEGEEERNGMLPDNAMMAMQQQQQGSLPENTGIGQLPAPNMQTMSAANGGIIAFDDGGEVPGYAGEDGSVVGQGFRKEPMFTAPKRSMSSMIKQKELESGAQGVQEEIAKLKEQLASLPPGPQRTFVEQRLQLLTGRAAASPTATPEARISKPYPTDAKPRAVDPTAGQAVTDANANPGYVPLSASSAPVARDTVPAPKEKRSGIAAIASPQGSQSETDAAVATAARLGGGAETDYKAKLANYGAEVKSGLDALALEREKGKPTGQAYSGLEASLKKDEEAAAGKEKRNLQMALVNAGLAIAGGTSRYALENIGKGAMVGTKQYMEGVDKLEAAAKERQKAMAMIEQERRAEARGDFKEKNEFAARRTEAELNAKKYSIDGLGKVFEVDKKSATDIFTTMQTNATRERMAQEQNKTELLKADKMAAAYKDRAGGANLADKAVDNTRALHDSWLKSPEGKLSFNKPGASDRKYQQILREQFRLLGIQMPGGGTPADGGQRPPLSQRTDLFQ
jgi:hypothetical protein